MVLFSSGAFRTCTVNTHVVCLENVENYHMLQTARHILHTTHTQRSTLKWEFLLRQKIIIKQPLNWMEIFHLWEQTSIWERAQLFKCVSHFQLLMVFSGDGKWQARQVKQKTTLIAARCFSCGSARARPHHILEFRFNSSYWNILCFSVCLHEIMKIPSVDFLVCLWYGIMRNT